MSEILTNTGITLWGKDDYGELWLSVFEQLTGSAGKSNLRLIDETIGQINESLNGYSLVYKDDKLYISKDGTDIPVSLIDSITGNIASSVDGKTITIDENGVIHGMTVDNAFDLTSTNAISNSAVSNKFIEVDEKLNTASTTLTDLSDKVEALVGEGEGSVKNIAETVVAEEVSKEVAKIVDNAPEDLDTLKEMSDWINNHASSAAEMNSSIQANTVSIEELKTNKANSDDLTAHTENTDVHVTTDEKAIVSKLGESEDGNLTYNGENIKGGGSSIVVSTTQPSNPNVGDLWLNEKKIKEIKHFNSSNEYDSTPIGCDAENVDMADGSTLEETITDLKNKFVVDSDLSLESENAVQNKAVMGYVSQLSNPNLLINPDFKINTSWAKSWSGVEQYTVNNWKQFSNIDGTVSIVDDGISLDNTNGYITFGQSVENGDLLAGETVTLSALVMQVSDNTPSGSVYVDVDGETLGASNLDGNLVKDEWVLLQTTVVLPPEITDNLTAAVYMSDTIGSIVIRWMKLEVGDRVTKFISPVYAEELAKCQLFNELLGKSMPLALTSSRTVYVDATNGSDDTGDGTQEKPWKTIQRAVDECPRINSHNSHYTIKLAEGVYDEIVRVVNMYYKVIITGADDNLLESCQKYKICMIAIEDCPFVYIRGVYMYGNDNIFGYGVSADRGVVEVQYCKFDGCGIIAGLGGLVRVIHTDLSNYQKNYGALYCSGGEIRCYDLSGSNNTIAFGAGVHSAHSGSITVTDNCTITASTKYETAHGGQIRFGSQGWRLIGSVTGANSVAIDSEKYTEFKVVVKATRSSVNLTTYVTSAELSDAQKTYGDTYAPTTTYIYATSIYVTKKQITLVSLLDSGTDVLSSATMTVYGRRA